MQQKWGHLCSAVKHKCTNRVIKELVNTTAFPVLAWVLSNATVAPCGEEVRDFCLFNQEYSLLLILIVDHQKPRISRASDFDETHYVCGPVFLLLLHCASLYCLTLPCGSLGLQMTQRSHPPALPSLSSNSLLCSKATSIWHQASLRIQGL